MIYEVNYEDISHTQKWSGVDVIAHELAHQFFGDTVTWFEILEFFLVILKIIF